MTPPSPAEEARTLVAATTQAALATLSEDGAPWASQVAFATLDDGTPVLCVSTLAEHGRNLERDPRASLVITEPGEGDDPLARARVTLAGVVERPIGTAARDHYVAALAPAGGYTEFGDFAFWVLRVERIRWVGGYGRMATVDPAEYAAAKPAP